MPLIVWITTNCVKFFKRWEYQITWPASWDTCIQVRKQQLEPDMEEWTGCKLGKKYIKAVYCHLAYLTYMQSTSCEMQGWMKHKIAGEISITSYMQKASPYGRKWRRAKEPLDEGERGKWKSLLKIQHSNNYDHGIRFYHFMANRWGIMETVKHFIFLGSRITTDGDCRHEIKRCLPLGRKAMTNLDSILKSRDITLLTKSV